LVDNIAGGLTQTGVLTAGTLNLTNTASDTTLDQDNVIANLGTVNCGTHTFTLKDTRALNQTGVLTADTLVLTNTAGNTNLNQDNIINHLGAIDCTGYTFTLKNTVALDQTAPLIAHTLSLINLLASTTLDNAGNAIDILGNIDCTGQTFTLRDDIITGITQSGYLKAGTLILTNTAGDTILNNSGNAIDILGNIDCTGWTFQLRDNIATGLTQSGYLKANTLILTNTAGNTTLDNPANAINILGTINCDSQTFTLVDNVAGGITQTGVLTAGTLNLTNTLGDTDLSTQNNNIANLGIVDCGANTFSLKDTRALTQSGALTAKTLNLINTAGNTTLDNVANAINILGTINCDSRVFTLVDNIAGGLTQTGVLTAGTLNLTNTASDTTLDNTGNSVANLGNIDCSGRNFTLYNTKALAQTAGPDQIIANLLTIDTSYGTGGGINLTNALNNVGSIDLTSKAGSNIQFTDSDDLVVITANAGTGNVTITSAAGSILDDYNESTVITGKNITLNAAAGNIGEFDSSPLDLTGLIDIALGTGTLTASAGGNIYIRETAKPVLLTSKLVLSSTGTDEEIGIYNSFGDITVDAPFATNQNLWFAANNINVNKSISTTADELSLVAIDDVNIAANITSADYVGILADYDDVGFGDLDDVGAIIRTAGTITTNYVDLSAATGIGSVGVPIVCVASTLQAENSTSGDINIDNTGSLYVVSIVNFGGDVYLVVHSDLTVDTIAGANVYLTADSGSILDGNGSGVNNVTADNLTLSAFNSIVLDVTVSTLLDASTSAFGAGSININSPTADLPIGLISANGGAGDVILRADAGSIIDANGGALNISAYRLVLSAATGIGSGDALETAVSYLNAYNSTSGNIEIDNTGDLTIDDFVLAIGWGVRNNGNAVIINASSSIDMPGTHGNGIWAKGGVTMTATTDITAGNDNDMTAVYSETGSILLDAGNDIYIGENGHYADILTNAGPGGITLTAGNDITIDNSTWVQSDTGNIDIIADGDIFLLATIWDSAWVKTGTGQITLDAGGDIIIDKDADGVISGSGDIILRADNNVDLGYVTTGGDVTVTADYDGVGGGAISDNNGADDNISATNLILSAATGIGSGDALETKVTNLQATNSTSGNIEISNTGSLTLVDILTLGYAVRNLGGEVNIQTSSPMAVSDKVLADSDITLYAAGGVTGDLTVGADVISYNGDVLIAADNDIVVNSGTIAASVGHSIALEADYYLYNSPANGGGITQNGGQIGSGVETIYVSGTDDTYIIKVTGYDVWLLSRWGQVYDAGSTSVTSSFLAIAASTGINLHTQTSSLFARNKTSSDIIINNIGGLSLDDLPGWGYAVQNLGGAIYIATTSPLTVNSLVTASGDITLNAGETNDPLTGADDLTINANIISTGGNILLQAGDDIIQNTGSTIETQASGKTIVLIAADSDLDGIGGITQNGTAVIRTNGGDITLTALDDIRLTLVDAGYPAGGNVTLTSTGGSIFDNDSGTVPGDYDIIGHNITLNAANDIGSAGAGQEVDLKMDGVLSLAFGGNCYLGIFGDVVLGAITGDTLSLNVIGNIYDDELDSTGTTDETAYDWTTINVNHLILSATGNIGRDYDTTDYDMDKGYLDIVLGIGGTINLTSDSDSSMDDGDIYIQITGNYTTAFNTNCLTLNTHGAGRDIVVVLSGTGPAALDGNLKIGVLSGFNPDDNITFMANGDITLLSNRNTNEDIVLLAINDIILNANLSSLYGNIEIGADGQSAYLGIASDSAGAISQAAGKTIIVVSNLRHLVMSAGSGIGTALAPIYTQARNVSLYNITGSTGTASGDIVVYNSGRLDLVDLFSVGAAVVNHGGRILITAASPININAPVFATGDITLTANDLDGDINVNALGTVHSTLGNILFDAGRDIVIMNDITADVGTIELKADGDIHQSGGTISAPTDIILTADNDGDFAGLISQSAGRILTTNLRASAATGISLASVTNNVDNIALITTSLGDIRYTDADDLIVTLLGAINGISAFLGDVTIATINGTLTINAPISAGTTGTLTLTSGEAGEGTVANILINDAITGLIIKLNSADNITEGGSGRISAQDLVIRAGSGTDDASVTLTNVLNNANKLAATITGSGILTFDYTDADNLAVDLIDSVYGITTNDGAITVTTVNGNLTINQPITAGDAPVVLTAGGLNRVLDNNSDITANAVTLTADRMKLEGGSVSAGAGRVILQTFTAGRAIDLGSATDGAVALELSDYELDTIYTSGILQIGNSTAGSITITAPIDTANVNSLTLINNGPITQIASLTEPNLRIESTGPITLDNVNNDVNILAANVSGLGNAFVFTDKDDLTIGTVDTVSGITTNNGDIIITTGDGGLLTLTQNINTNGADLWLNSGAAINQTGGTIAADEFRFDAKGAVTLTSAGNDVNTIAGQTTAAGAIQFTDIDDLIVGAAFGLSGITSSAGNITLNTGALLTLAADIIAHSDIWLNSLGAINQTAGSIIANGLRFDANGYVTVTQPGNDVDTIAGRTTAAGDIQYTDADDLTVGSVLSLDGIVSAAGNITLKTLNGTMSILKLVSAGASNLIVKTAEAAEVTDAGITLSANLVGSTIKLTSADGILQTAGSVLATDLVIRAAAGDADATATLNSATNNVTNLAATYLGSGKLNLNYTDADDLNISSVDGIDGISTNGGDVNLVAQGSIEHILGGDVYTSGGSYTATADSDGNGTGHYYMNGLTIDTTGTATDGDVTITCGNSGTVSGGEDIDVGFIYAADGTVRLTTYGGSIHDGPPISNIVADTLYLTAPAGDIYDLITDINNLYAHAGGYIYIEDIDSLTLQDVEAGTYTQIYSNNNMYVNYVSAPWYVVLQSYNGSIYGNYNYPDAQTPYLYLYAYNGSIDITTDIDYLYAYAGAGITIRDIGSLTLVDVQGCLTLPFDVYVYANDTIWVNHVSDPFNVYLQSYNGSIYGYYNYADVYTSNLYLYAYNGSIDITTDIDNLYAYAGGYIYIEDIGSLTLQDVQAGLSSYSYVQIYSNNNMYVNYVSAPWYVLLQSYNNSIIGLGVNPVEINTPTLYLYAYNGSIYGGYDPLGLTYGGSNFLTTNASYIVQAFADGDIYIYDTGNVYLGSVVSDISDVYIAAYGDIEVEYVEAAIDAILEALNGSILGQDIAPVDISAPSAYIYATNAIYGNYSPGGFYYGGSNFLTTSASYIEAIATDEIYIYDTGSVNLGDVESDDSDVYIAADGDIDVDYVYADDAAILEAQDGAIIDNNGGATNIEAEYSALYALDGIGSGDALETIVSYLEAMNEDSGNIEIDNTGDLTIDAWTGIGDWGIENDGDDVIINAASSIDIPGTNGNGIWAQGDVTLTATDDITAGSDNSITSVQSNSGSILLNAGHDIYLGENGYADIYTDDGPGSITLIAGNDITIDNDTYIESDTGDINITAGNDASLISTGHIQAHTTGNINITATNGDVEVGPNAGGVLSGTGDIALTAANNVDIGYVSTAGDVTITADSDSLGTGAITDNNGNNTNIVANHLVLSSAQGIGSGDALETAVSYLNAYNSTSGNIEIDNTGDLTIDDFALGTGWGVRNNGNAVIINAASSIDIPGTNGNGIWAQGDVTLTATDDITAGSDNSITSVQSNSGSVLLNAGNDIYLGVNGYADIYTNDGPGGITLIAGHDITIDNDTYIESDTGDINITAGNNASLISTGHISADTTGNVNITATNGNITIGPNAGGVLSGTGDITLKAGNNVDIGYLETAGDVSITADNDGNGTGAITDNNGGNTNIVGVNLTLAAAQGIGSFIDALETIILNLIATNSTSGDISIINTGTMYASNVANLAGNVYLTANSDLIVGSILGNNVYLTAATGSILDDTAVDPTDSNNIKGILVSLTALNTIGSNTVKGDIDTDADTVNCSAGGDIYLEEKTGADFSLITSGGFVDILAHGSSLLGLITTVSDFVFNTTAGDITITGTVESTTAGVYIVADNGSLYASYTPGAGQHHIIAHADSLISVPHGVIGIKINPLVIIPINVEIINGILIVDIGGLIGTPYFGQSGYLEGSISPLNIPILFPNYWNYPALDLYPPGQVFWNGQLIWPPLPSQLGNYQYLYTLYQGSTTATRFLLPVLESLIGYQINAFDFMSSAQFAGPVYFYHPLTETDMSAFDTFILDVGAYEFIDGNINMLGHDNILSILEEIKKKKKKLML
jgi:hypothetical protein